jgi:sarcosine oxidase gamma subunit
MDNSDRPIATIEVDGLCVKCEPALQIAALRYFDAAGPFAAALLEIIGRPLPEPLRATSIEGATGEARFILAWRSPTETLILSSDRVAFSELGQRLVGVADGCMVDQTGGVWPLRVQGYRARDLLLRLGSATSIPRAGEARGGRLAELHVLMVCIQPEEFLLFVERVYANHLLEWIGATAADLSITFEALCGDPQTRRISHV